MPSSTIIAFASLAVDAVCFDGERPTGIDLWSVVGFAAHTRRAHLVGLTNCFLHRDVGIIDHTL